jgi:hypothetical protein
MIFDRFSRLGKSFSYNHEGKILCQWFWNVSNDDKQSKSQDFFHFFNQITLSKKMVHF